jgi:hypothetical protein
MSQLVPDKLVPDKLVPDKLVPDGVFGAEVLVESLLSDGLAPAVIEATNMSPEAVAVLSGLE